MSSVLVVGATGTLGRRVVAQLKEEGHRVRGLSRDAEQLQGLPVDEAFAADLAVPGSLAGACAGVEVVVSCAGASMRLDRFRDRRSFSAVDYGGNVNLLAEARRAGVGRFVYVSLYGADRLSDTAYARAHERFVEVLQASGLRHTVVRPTGFFSFLTEILRLAKSGRGVVIGSGEARTNPVHEADVAEACAAALAGGAEEVLLGGPVTYTRREIVELAFDVLGAPPRITHVPPWLFRGLGAAARPLNPRIAALLIFGAAASTTDLVAPAVGTRDLPTYFRSLLD